MAYFRYYLTIKIKEKYNKVSKTWREYTCYREERDGVIHKGTKDEAIDAFRKSNTKELTHSQILYILLKVWILILLLK